jgi:hypothetical protein
VVALSAGSIASVALIGFGLDSVIDVSPAAAVAWHSLHRPEATGTGSAARLARCRRRDYWFRSIRVESAELRSTTAQGDVRGDMRRRLLPIVHRQAVATRLEA